MFLKRDFAFWHCPACDFMFVDPFPGHGLYDDAYYSGRGPDPFVDYESEFLDYRSTGRMAEFDDLWRVASRYVERNLPAGDIEWLDFGCGSGGLMKYLRDRGAIVRGERSWRLRVSGHDVGSYADRLAAQDGFRILTVAGLQAEPDCRYDVISLIEVAEHLESPDPVFALVARLLKPGGLLLLTTGNMGSVVARIQGLAYGYVIPDIHVGYYTPRALERLYARHGLAPVRFRYKGTVRFKVAKTLRTAGRQRLAMAVLGMPMALRLVDWLFGTSRVPCAFKPRRRGGGPDPQM